MDFLWAAVFYGLAAYWVWRIPFFRNCGISPLERQVLLALKMMAATALYGVYAFYYGDRNTSDALRFFDDAAIIHRLWATDASTWAGVVFGFNTESAAATALTDTLSHWHRERFTGILNDNRLMIRLNALIMIFSRGNYYIHMVVMMFLSFIGLTGIYRGLQQYLPLLNRRVLMSAVFLLPGVWFWSSGVLKEALMFFVLGLQFHFLVRWVKSENMRASALGFVLLIPAGMMVKPYVFLIFWMVSAWLFVSYFYQHRLVFSWITFHLLLAICILGIDAVWDGKLLALLVQKQHDFIALSTVPGTGSAFSLLPLQSDWMSVVLLLPTALANALLRPMIWEAHNPPALMAAIENTGILVLMAVAFLFRKRGLRQEKDMFLIALGFSVWLFALAGLTTPVAGALVRYKIPALPFLVAVLLAYVDVPRLKAAMRLGVFLPLFLLFSCIKPEKADHIIHNADIRYCDPAGQGIWREARAEAAAYKNNILLERGAQHQILNKYGADLYVDMQGRPVFLPRVQVLYLNQNTASDTSSVFCLALNADPSDLDIQGMASKNTTYFLNSGNRALQYLSKYGAMDTAGRKLGGMSVSLSDSGWSHTLKVCALLGYRVHLYQLSAHDTSLLQQTLHHALQGPNDRRWIIEIPCDAPDAFVSLAAQFSLIPLLRDTCRLELKKRSAEANKSILVYPAPKTNNPVYSLHSYTGLMALFEDSLAMGWKILE
jgi:hypothetical protein